MAVIASHPEVEPLKTTADIVPVDHRRDLGRHQRVSPRLPPSWLTTD